MPHENVTAITAAHHVFGLRPKEIDPFDGFTISAIRILSDWLAFRFSTTPPTIVFFRDDRICRQKAKISNL